MVKLYSRRALVRAVLPLVIPLVTACAGEDGEDGVDGVDGTNGTVTVLSGGELRDEAG